MEKEKSVSKNRKSIMFRTIEERNIYNTKKDNIHPRLSSLLRRRYTENLKKFLEERKMKISRKCNLINWFRYLKKKIVLQITDSIFQAIISLIATILYITGTYYPSDSSGYTTILYFELVLGLVISLTLIIKFYQSPDKFNFFFKFVNIIDIVTTISVFLKFIISSNSLGFLRIFRIVRVIRVLRIIKFITFKKNFQEKHDLFKKIFESCLIILVYIFFCAALIQFLCNEFKSVFGMKDTSVEVIQCYENGQNFSSISFNLTQTSYSIGKVCDSSDKLIKQETNLSFDSSLYFLIITVFTIGYGDIVPDVFSSELMISFIIIVMIIIVTKQMGEINQVIEVNQKMFYDTPYEYDGYRHVILGGFFNRSSLEGFLNEFYNEDHTERFMKNNNKAVKIVIIQPKLPEEDILNLINNPLFRNKIKYIRGDILDKNILKMAKIEKAKHVFLLSDQEKRSIKKDNFLSLSCKSISQISDSKVLVQYNYTQSLLNDWTDYRLSFSSNQIKNHILVKNCFIHGFSTMIMNLSSSSSEFYIKDISETPWMIEYIEGASQEFYIINDPSKTFNFGKNFTDLTVDIYLKFGIILIGIRHKVFYKDRNNETLNEIFYYEYLINPVDYILNEDDSLIVIAKDREVAMSIFENPIEKHQKLSESRLYYLKGKFIDETDYGIDMEAEEIPYIFEKQKEFNSIECEAQLAIYLFNHFIVFSDEDSIGEFASTFNKLNKEIIYYVKNKNDADSCDSQGKDSWKKFKNIIKININYDSEEELELLNLEKSRHTFILSYPKVCSIPDSGILSLVKLIESRFPRTKYTIDFVNEHSVKYLKNDIPEVKRTKTNQIISGKELLDLIPFKVWPKFAKSDIFFSRSLDTLLPFSYHNKGLLELIIKILGIENEKDRNSKIFHKIEENNTFSVLKFNSNIPITFKEVFQFLLEVDAPLICIGIYRTANGKTQTGDEMNNNLPYILTNPDRDVNLNQNDELICIGKTRFFRSNKRRRTSVFNLDTMNSPQRSIKSRKHSQKIIMKNDTLGVDYQFTSDKFLSSLEMISEEDLIEEFKSKVTGLKNSLKMAKSALKKHFSINDQENFSDDDNENQFTEDNRLNSDEEKTKNDFSMKPIDSFNFATRRPHRKKVSSKLSQDFDRGSLRKIDEIMNDSKSQVSLKSEDSQKTIINSITRLINNDNEEEISMANEKPRKTETILSKMMTRDSTKKEKNTEEVNHHHTHSRSGSFSIMKNFIRKKSRKVSGEIKKNEKLKLLKMKRFLNRRGLDVESAWEIFEKSIVQGSKDFDENDFLNE